MWIRSPRTVFARMPSMRPQPGPAAPVVQSRPVAPAPAGRPAAPAAARQAPPPAPPEPERPEMTAEEEERARGGFHESSYELRTGMDIVEGDWPDDTTIPGALGDR